MTLASGLGVDVGSTTVKVVAVRDGSVFYRDYRRHHGRPREVAGDVIRASRANGAEGNVVLTGSCGAALESEMGGAYVHEVHAVAATVRARFPSARTAIEIGGQDAKMIHIEDGSVTSEMNERCAAGTGATLDRCLHRLGLPASGLSGLSIPDGELPVVSGKCGVFAESDLVALVKANVPRELVMAALLDSIVRGCLTVLARGRPLAPDVVLLGGPHAFVPALADLWRRHLRSRWRERDVVEGEVIVPDDAAFFAAEGALRARSTRRISLSSSARALSVGPGLLRDGEPPPDPPVEPVKGEPRGKLVLGIDAGSTTIKAVVLDELDRIVARTYRRSERGPLEEIRFIAEELGELPIEAAVVTGYAADVLAPVIGAGAIVETLAHARAALRFVPDADVVCDVGGQDIKILMLGGGAVRDFRLSHQCAAGNGALLEATAHDLGVALEDYAKIAFSARRAPVLSTGCAVFLDTERITCQKNGFSPAEILAGFAMVLPRNIWENVAATRSIADLGDTFVLSGGVQRNLAAVKAQIDYLRARHPRARVVVHPHPGEAGAIGAALAARSSTRSSFIGLGALRRIRFVSRNDRTTRCTICPSACARTIVQTDGGARFITGHGCERGAESTAASAPRAGARNLLRVEAERLFTLPGPGRRSRDLRVAIPRALSMARSAPLFLRYFDALGASIETGEWTSESLWMKASGRGTVDACFPVKVAQAHVADLLRRNVDVVFFPILTHAATPVRGSRDTASCPVVAGTPLVTRAAFGARGDHLPNARLLTPRLSLTDPERLSHELYDALHPLMPDLSWNEHVSALEQARAWQRSFERDLEREGEKAIERARSQGRAVFVLLARPYHVDPGIHHDIGSELWALGRTTLSFRALPKAAMSLDLGPVAPQITNSGAAEKIAAARFIATQRLLVGIEVSSFKCGQDASLYAMIASLARTGGKPFLALHDLDETRPIASLRLRLRTFLDAVERWERA
jgi:predicted CoA-substrate-specific enzyme activase